MLVFVEVGVLVEVFVLYLGEVVVGVVVLVVCD